MMQEEIQGPVNATLHRPAKPREAAGTSRRVNKEDKPVRAEDTRIDEVSSLLVYHLTSSLDSLSI